MRTASVVLPLLVAGVAAVASAACSTPAPRASPAPVVASSAGPAPSGWSHVVTADAQARSLAIEASFDAGNGDLFRVDADATPFVSDVTRQTAAGWEPVPRQDDGWLAPCAAGCRLRYRFGLASAARALDDVDLARLTGDAVLGSPAAWLLRPAQVSPARPWTMRVAGAPFVTGITSSDGAFVAATDDLPEAPYSGFGAFRRRTLVTPHGSIELAIAPQSFTLGDEALAAWVRGAATRVGGYFGRLPVASAVVFLVGSPGHGVAYGRTLGNGGAGIVIEVGTSISDDEIRDDWVMNHELLHLGFPTMPAEHSWIEEGIATYVEPLLRARAGTLPAAEVWADFVERMPQGQPAPDDQGLDHTPTWGRTYWGGAAFCLQADVLIRERSRGRHSLDDALRAIVAAGGTVARRWPLAQALALGDQATGTHVLEELHTQYGDRPAPFALDALWGKLGVVARRGGGVSLDERAPLASVRRAITGR